MVTFLPQQPNKITPQANKQTRPSDTPTLPGTPADSVLFSGKGSRILAAGAAAVLLPLSACSDGNEGTTSRPDSYSYTESSGQLRPHVVVLSGSNVAKGATLLDDGIVINTSNQPLGHINEKGEAFILSEDGKEVKVASADKKGNIFAHVPYKGKEYTVQIGKLDANGEVTDASGEVLCSVNIEGATTEEKGAVAALVCFEQDDKTSAKKQKYSSGNYNPGTSSVTNNTLFWMWWMAQQRNAAGMSSYTVYKNSHAGTPSSPQANKRPSFSPPKKDSVQQEPVEKPEPKITRNGLGGNGATNESGG